MPSPFCLLPQYVDEFMDRVKTGKLSAAKLAAMTSEERHTAFSEFMGDANATRVNASFESKLLLKNQQKGITDWVKNADKISPAVKRDILSRVQRMDQVLQPTQMHGFLEDLAKQRLGFGVTQGEAATLTALAKDVATAKAANDFPAYMDARIAFREGMGAMLPHNLTTAQGLAAFVRTGALSWPTTLVKLTGVAISRFITTPITDAAAMGVAKVFPGLSEGAPRYGTTSVTVAMQAEAAAHAAAWTDGITDAGRMLRNKPSRLDLAHGEDTHVAHAWYEYMGSLHGALKEVVKRAEYARSLVRRTAEASGRGEDINDLTVKMRLSTEAYRDGQAAISMQSNVITDSWNAGLRRLEQPDKVTGKASPLGTFVSTALRMDTPVMKAPTNIVLEASDYIGGTLTGGARTAYAYAHGIEDLKPVERDAIIRQMARGSVGAALMTLYYFKHDLIQFGGFYQPGEKRSPSDVAPGAARIGDTDIPKQLLHNPLLDALQFSASMARVADHPKHGDESGIVSAAGAATLGLLRELPVFSTAEDLTKIVKSADVDALENKLAGAFVPGMIQWIAKVTDDEPKRKPTGIVEHLEANIPGLRQNVPTHKRKGK